MDGQPAPCLNCGAPLHGAFCCGCGQRAKLVRLETRDLLEGLVNAVVGIDAAFPRTVRDLTLRPGQAIRDYVEGHRRRYIGPPQYLLFSVGALILAMAIRDVSTRDFAPAWQAALAPADVVVATDELMRMIDRHMQFLVFSQIPFFAWVAGLLHRDSGTSFAERCVLFTYTVAHMALLGSAERLVAGAGSLPVNLGLGAVGLAYYAWATRRFFRTSWPVALLTVVAAYAGWIMTLATSTGILIGVVMILSRT